jgi:3-oxoacyl-[acyl-carrier protein] reductase
MTQTDNAKPKVALVSGGSKGLGLGIVEALLRQGYAVSTFARAATPDMVRLAAAYSGRFYFSKGDMEDRESLRHVVSEAEEKLGGINVLINNAGTVHEQILVRHSDEQIDRVVDVNLKGTLFLTRAAIRHMMIAKWGRIVNISSIVGSRGFPGLAPYSATKAALDGATRALARELGPRNITVNSVAPGYMETDLVKNMNQDQLRRLVRRTPLGRAGKVEDVVGPILFFISDAGSFTTGQTLIVDGGITC